MKLPRLYPILDTETLARRNCPVEVAAEAMLEGGARILQFRHKGRYSREVFEPAERVAELCRRAGALFIVDDRADIAVLLDAGLHVGQDDLAPADARRLLGPSRILGFSTHNAEQLGAGDAETVDYLAIGPIFGTGSKADPDPVVGLDNLRRWRRLTQKPLVAIGGITRANARQVLEAGADSVAVIGDLYPESLTYERVLMRIEQWKVMLNA